MAKKKTKKTGVLLQGGVVFNGGVLSSVFTVPHSTCECFCFVATALLPVLRFPMTPKKAGSYEGAAAGILFFIFLPPCPKVLNIFDFDINTLTVITIPNRMLYRLGRACNRNNNNREVRAAVCGRSSTNCCCPLLCALAPW